MKKIVLLILSFAALLGADEGLKKVVFDLTAGDIKVFEKKVLTGIVFQKNYYENKMEELEVAVVIHGDAYKFFIKDLAHSPYKNDVELRKKQKEFEKRLESASSNYHVVFLICEAGMAQRKISKETLYPFVTGVTNSTIGLIDKQNEGYAYVPIRE